jgi:hypothetical protein
MDRANEGIGKRFLASIPGFDSTIEPLDVGAASGSHVLLPDLQNCKTTVIFHCASLEEDDYVEVIAPPPATPSFR